MVQTRDTLYGRHRRAAAGYGAHNGAGQRGALLIGKTSEATREQIIDQQAAILAALGKRNGTSVIGGEALPGGN